MDFCPSTFCPLITCLLSVMCQQDVSHGFLSCNILSTDHLFAFCDALTAGELWIPVWQHSVCPLIAYLLSVMPQQRVSHGFLSCNILSIDHLFALCDALTVGEW